MSHVIYSIDLFSFYWFILQKYYMWHKRHGRVTKEVVVVVYHVTIVAIGHGLLKKFSPFLVLGCVLRTAGNSIIEVGGQSTFPEAKQELPVYIEYKNGQDSMYIYSQNAVQRLFFLQTFNHII